MPTLTIDGVQVTVDAGTSIIEAAKKLGKDTPHFCYHPKLSVAGNCRMCLVDVEKSPKPVISCQAQCGEGMVVHTDTPNVKALRKNVLEFILINHPIDCPVCDQAGECKLQEYYMKHSISDSQMMEEKVHKPKRVDLGPLVVLDSERCVLCSRCIRFCDEISKTGELCFSHRGDHETLTTFPGMQLDNKYSLNTVDICPVGALTNKDFRFECRVWFLQETASVCNGCSTGCNIKINHNDGKIHRYLPRDNEAVNQCWLCDEGRLSYKYVNAESRLLRPRKQLSNETKPLAPKLAVQELMDSLKHSKDLVFVGSAYESNENNYALKKLAKTLGTTELYYTAREVANPSQDDFLIKADKNPNRAGVIALGFKPLTEAKLAGKIVVVLDGLNVNELAKLKADAPKLLIALSSNENSTTQIADWVLPSATFAEQIGTFTNFQKRAQYFTQALAVKGDVRPSWQWLKEMALLAGDVWKLSSEEAFFKEAFNLSYAELGAEGKVLA